MSNLQIIEALCKLVESMSEIIRHLVFELAMQRTLTDVERDMVRAAKDRYVAIIDSNDGFDSYDW